MKLNIGSGHRAISGFESLDMQALDGVEHVWDVNAYPWPFGDGSVEEAVCFHLVEHIPPVAIDNGKTWFPFLAFMDEAWRVLEAGAALTIEAPVGGSHGYIMDPTHCNPVNKETWLYFSPKHCFYDIYQPCPWEIQECNEDHANVRVVLVKRDG